MKLWAADIPCLDGFYMSHVIALGETLDEAVQNAFTAYQQYCLDFIEERGWHPFSESSLTGPSNQAADEIQAAEQLFRMQTTARLTEQPAALILVRN